MRKNYVVFKADAKPVEVDSSKCPLGTVPYLFTEAYFNILKCNYDTSYLKNTLICKQNQFLAEFLQVQNYSNREKSTVKNIQLCTHIYLCVLCKHIFHIIKLKNLHLSEKKKIITLEKYKKK